MAMIRRPPVRPSSVSSSVRPSSTISKIFFSETALPIKLKFYVEPPWIVALEYCSRYLGHMTKMAATPIYGKNNLLLQNRWAHFHETWFVASRTSAHCSFINDDPGMTLTYFTARSNLETEAFTWEKVKTMDFLKTIVA